MTKFKDEELANYKSWLENDYLGCWGNRGGMPKDWSLKVEFEYGSKFVRVVTSNLHGEKATGRSSHSFISLGGDKWPRGTILKSASWRAPAQNFARGHIKDERYPRVSWAGVA